MFLNGDSINIRTDNLGLEGLNGVAVNSNLLNPNESSVKDLWLDDSRRWNNVRVRELYGQDLGDKICNSPIGEECQCDRVVWFHNPLGSFTSKSTYSWLLLKQMGFGPHRFLWKAIWKLDTIPKIWVFTWWVGHEILPTNVEIASIGRGFGQECPRCGAEYETLIHTLKDSPTSRAILSTGESHGRPYDYLWNSWNNRNNFIFQGKEDEAQVVWDRARTLSQDFRICNLLNDP
ncbi:hypothetical protein Gotri_000163 [Gossypium trilobum]|uniref:Reverse transcriptase zinc-binding domain-containing protein n=1 Tax=Gossypium trilobum TaxID=34281 RepID=A0A7J9FNE3_9ROSI|nr:hypothetical protein [Gossypium trilobum]